MLVVKHRTIKTQQSYETSRVLVVVVVFKGSRYKRMTYERMCVRDITTLCVTRSATDVKLFIFQFIIKTISMRSFELCVSVFVFD